MKLKVKKSYRKSGNNYLLMLVNRILESLKGNQYFPEPTPAHPLLEKIFQEFRVAVSIAGRYDRTLSSAKNDKKAELIRSLDELADYVNETSKGDKTMLLSSGFDIVGIRAANQNLGPIEQLDVVIGPTGQAVTKVNKVTGAKAYIHQCTPDPVTPDSTWTSETTTDNVNTFSNLNSIAKYWFRVIAIGKSKQQVFSVLVSRVIQ